METVSTITKLQPKALPDEEGECAVNDMEEEEIEEDLEVTPRISAPIISPVTHTQLYINKYRALNKHAHEPTFTEIKEESTMQDFQSERCHTKPDASNTIFSNFLEKQHNFLQKKKQYIEKCIKQNERIECYEMRITPQINSKSKLYSLSPKTDKRPAHIRLFCASNKRTLNLSEYSIPEQPKASGPPKCYNTPKPKNKNEESFKFSCSIPTKSLKAKFEKEFNHVLKKSLQNKKILCKSDLDTLLLSLRLLNEIDNSNLKDRIQLWNCMNPDEKGEALASNVYLILYSLIYATGIKNEAIPLSQAQAEALHYKYRGMVLNRINSPIMPMHSIQISSFSPKLCNKSYEIVKNIDASSIQNKATMKAQALRDKSIREEYEECTFNPVINSGVPKFQSKEGFEKNKYYTRKVNVLSELGLNTNEKESESIHYTFAPMINFPYSKGNPRIPVKGTATIISRMHEGRKIRNERQHRLELRKGMPQKHRNAFHN